jgi:hypothetical protein
MKFTENKRNDDKDEKKAGSNPEKGTGKQDREQDRTSPLKRDPNYGDDFGVGTNEQKRGTESTTFEQDIENEQQNDPERNPQKRKPLGEDEAEVAKKGKIFEPKSDEDDINAV